MTMKVKIGDFGLESFEKKEIVEWLDSGRISEGPKVKSFEKQWADFVGVKHCTVVNSGTSALIAGLCAMKHLKMIKAESKVITSPLTYIATSNAIVHSGLDPVYVDVERETFNITPENIKAALEKDNKDVSLILPVHLIGYPVKMDEVNKIAKKYYLKTLEDSAQAHGTIYKGRRTGSMSDVSTFSFYIAHNIQGGELGAVVTNNTELNKTVMKIKANGRVCDCDECTRDTNCERYNESFDPRFTHEIIGYNFKTIELPALLALQQLRKINMIISKRQENVKYLNEGLKRFSDKLQTPLHSKDVSYLAYPLVITDKSINRENLCKKLEKEGVETRPLFGCIPTQQPAFSHLKKKYGGKLPNAEYLGKNAFYIGCHQYLTQEDLDFAIKAFAKCLK